LIRRRRERAEVAQGGMTQSLTHPPPTGGDKREGGRREQRRRERQTGRELQSCYNESISGARRGQRLAGQGSERETPEPAAVLLSFAYFLERLKNPFEAFFFSEESPTESLASAVGREE
jgi:hypothetical protein